jgi:hypothetical protein
MEKIGRLGPLKTRDIIKALHLLPSINFEATPDLEAAALMAFGDSRSFLRYLISEAEDLLDDARFLERTIAVGQVFKYRTYWKRLWIAQELISAAEITIMCGRRSVDLRLFILADFVLLNGVRAETGSPILLPALDHETTESLLFATLKANRFNLLRGQGQVSLAENIRNYSSMICSERRDYIYALLNISTPIQIPIDYQLSTNVIYRQATRQIIQQDNSIDVIFKRPYSNQTDSSRRSDIVTPSWVPRYHTHLSDGLTSILNCTAGGLIQENRFMGQFATQYNDLVLQLNGYYGPKIEQAFPFFPEDGSWGEVWETILALKSQLVQNSGTKVGRIWQKIRPQSRHFRQIKKSVDRAEERNFPFWNTLVMGLYDKTSAHRDQVMAGNGALTQQFMQDIEAALNSALPPPDRLIRRLFYSISGRKFCWLSGGRMALVHGDAEIGDILFIARGASVPLIIRPTDPSFQQGKRRADDPDPEFTFVGGAYMAGVMDGEVVQEMDKMNFKDESIRLV